MTVIGHVYISPAGVMLNGQSYFQSEQGDWLKELYTTLELEYPKFHKMDSLSKMAFLATEILKANEAFPDLTDEEISLIFANNSASQETDMKFIDSYTTGGSPSPSLFVYTLPNIVTGELAIRNKWYGENTFFISKEFDEGLFKTQIQFAFDRGASHCLCGWVEANTNKTEECLLFLVQNSKESETLNVTDLINNYRNERT